MASRAWVLALLFAVAGAAQARVDVASVGSNARSKPNVLILLDTSGSMAGVAGDPFGPATEVGMDCEHGENCRLGGLSTQCQASKRPCQSTLECQSGHCTADNRSSCSRDGDCPQGLGRCSQSGGSCSRDGDCPQPKCLAQKVGGTCGSGGRGCEANNDCPTAMRCQTSGDLCRQDSDCPLFQSAICGGGARSGRACAGDSDCPAGRCVSSPANPCVGTANPCQLSDKPCRANLCEPAAASTCRLPASPSDVCAPVASGGPGPLRMCQGSQKLCSQDADCGTIDLCGPATSRAMIVKRALGKLVVDNHEQAKFGLMTLFQDSSFPYVATDASASETTTVFLAEDQLRRLGCFTWDAHTGTGGPSAICSLEGRQAILRATADSRYRVSAGEVEFDFCGAPCELPAPHGMGTYLGSSYWVRRTLPAKASQEVLVRDRYSGDDITVGGRSYAYFTPRNDYYNGGALPPLGAAECRDSCGVRCGGRWDAQLVPFLVGSDTPERSLSSAEAIVARLDAAAHGGLVSLWGSPIGCALENDVSPTPSASAFHYMSAVKQGVRSPDFAVAPDPVACRTNVVLLVTDGAPNGPGDVDGAGRSLCAEPACAADDPKAAGCRCRSVLAAHRLHRELGVTVMVVGFSSDASEAEAAAANHNVARAGGSGRARLTMGPRALEQALETSLGQALGTGVASAWVQSSAGGKGVVTTRTELPGGHGQVSAFVSSDREPRLLWDMRAQSGAWKQRRVFTSNGSKLVEIRVDQATGDIRNADELAAVGMGADADEAGRVARWLLEDSSTALAASPSSRPVEVGPPRDSNLPGGHAHFLRHAKRPRLVFLGAADQMLHAFFAEPVSVGGAALPAGSEAFAFLPPDLLPRVRQLYLQGGQRPNPAQRLLGVAGSPQSIELCLSGCADEKTALWKTLLVVSEGPGGQHAFALDVTKPLGPSEPPFALAWHTGYGGRAQPPVWQDSVAAPAHLFNPSTELSDHLLVSASGFGVGPLQRPSVSARRARDGSVAWSKPLSPKIGCTHEYEVVSDVAVARAGEHEEQTVAGYFGDTAGQLWGITPGGGLGVLADFTCDHPLHFSPTVVQHVGAPGTASADRDFYLVQVTNSYRRRAFASGPASQMVFLKQTIDMNKQGHVMGVHPDTQWGQGGRISLVVGGRELCAQTHKAGDEAICDLPLPGTARPLGKPLAWPHARGFRVATVWGVPSPSVCEPGRHYLTVHQVEANRVAQVLGALLKSHAPAPSPVVMEDRLFVFDGSGQFEAVTLD